MIAIDIVVVLKVALFSAVVIIITGAGGMPIVVASLGNDAKTGSSSKNHYQFIHLQHKLK